METRSQLARMYLNRAFQINISADLGRVLKTMGWDHKEEVFAYYDGQKDRIVITKNFLEAKKHNDMLEIKNAEGRICTLTPGPREGYELITVRGNTHGMQSQV